MQICDSFSVLSIRTIRFPWKFYASTKTFAGLRDSVLSLCILYWTVLCLPLRQPKVFQNFLSVKASNTLYIKHILNSDTNERFGL